jgi:PHP family Zn ribbon phosphoesterase
MNERGEVTGENRRLLIGATDLPLGEVVRTIHGLGGMAIAAHVDRPSFSLISQLGFVPPGLQVDGVEVCSDALPALPQRLSVVRSSDAHRPEEIGSRYTLFLLESPTASEIEMALRRIEGRRILT